MAISVAMGANTIRAHTLGISTGTSLSVWPSSYNTNNDAVSVLRIIDREDSPEALMSSERRSLTPSTTLSGLLATMVCD